MIRKTSSRCVESAFSRENLLETDLFSLLRLQPVAQKAGSLDSLFAKQSKTPSKPKAKSPDSSISASPAPKEKVEASEVIMNPDEDTKVTSEQLEKIEEDEESKEEGNGKGKKREVETLELSSGGEEEEEDVKPSKGKKRKVVKKEENPEKKTDGDGNVKLDGFFKVLD
jgi:hypothetical protein